MKSRFNYFSSVFILKKFVVVLFEIRFHVWVILWKPFMQPSILTCWSCTTFMKFVKGFKGVSILYNFGGYISNCCSLNLNPWSWTPKISNIATQEWKDKHEPILGWQNTNHELEIMVPHTTWKSRIFQHKKIEKPKIQGIART